MNFPTPRKIIAALQSRKHRYFVNKERRLWLKAQTDLQIHSSLEFTGVELPYKHIQIGSGSIIERDITIWVAQDTEAKPQLAIGENAFVGRNTYIGLYQPVSIGSHALIGAYCYIISANHCYEKRDIPIVQQGFRGAPVVIEEDVWLGTHVVVLPGVTIGKGAIVAAGSIVNKSIPPFEIWGGTPAKFLKERP